MPDRLELQPSYHTGRWLACCNIIGFGVLAIGAILLFSIFSFVAFYRALREVTIVDAAWWMSAAFSGISILLCAIVAPACLRHALAEIKSRYTLQADEERLTILDANGKIRTFPWSEIESVGIRSYYIGCQAVNVRAEKSFSFGLLLSARDLTRTCDWIIAKCRRIK